MDRPAVFGPAKDRPVLFTAAAWAEVLLTLDRGAPYEQPAVILSIGRPLTLQLADARYRLLPAIRRVTPSL